MIGVECNPSPAFIKNEVLVTARVNAFGFVGTRVTARVSYNDADGKEHVWNEDFTLEREKANELKVSIKAPDKKGEIKVRVEVGVEKDGKIEPLPGELSPLNNWSETYLTVNKEGVRVLIVDQLRWEETRLRDALRSQKGFDVYEVIRQTDLVPSEGEKALLNLEAQAYDVVIIGNVSGAHLQRAAPDFLPKLAELAAKKGVGVMFLGGEYAFQGIPDTLLPLAGGPIVDKLDEAGNPKPPGYPAVPTARGLEKMFRVAGKPGEAPKPGASEEAWNRMNNFRTGFRLNGYNRLTLTKQQEALYTVFAWTGDESDPKALAAGGDAKGEPLLVGSQRGDANKGRWLAFGAFDTYLWGSLGQPKTTDGVEMHHRFWRQCVLWLAHQDEEESQVYARPQYRQLKVTGEQTVRVGMKKPDGSDDPTAQLTVRVVPLPPGVAEPKPEDEKKAVPLPVLTDKDGRKVLFRAGAGRVLRCGDHPGEEAGRHAGAETRRHAEAAPRDGQVHRGAGRVRRDAAGERGPGVHAAAGRADRRQGAAAGRPAGVPEGAEGGGAAGQRQEAAVLPGLAPQPVEGVPAAVASDLRAATGRRVGPAPALGHGVAG